MRPPLPSLGLLATITIIITTTAIRAATANGLPYNPTRVLTAPNASHAYIFQPALGSAGGGQSQLSALNFSNAFASSQQAFQLLSPTLPFLRDDELLPYTPTIDADGSITVIAGNCSLGVAGAQLWRFVPDTGGLNGSWTQVRSGNQEQGTEEQAVGGSNFLANSLSFPEPSGSSDSRGYVFGGMCPLANSTVATWISAAEYSSLMLTLSPSGSGAAEQYTIDALPDHGPPIAQAGSSITPLLPAAYPGTSAQGQQRDFVLLGGHTQEAFINMSQVALFSLPQQAWAFVPVQQPASGGGGGQNSRRQNAPVEVTPRSGHTAVLSESGNSIIVFGGWVGDIKTPAEPQLAVLDLGAAYGESGDWSWSAPQQSGKGPATGSGLFGHGATMLPGGIMMIVGGYQIQTSSASSSSSSRRRRRDAQQPNNAQILFYNTTSNAWLQSYTPNSISPSSGSIGKTGHSSTQSQKAGLGAGLSIGAALLITLVLFYFWYTRRLRRAREKRGHLLLSRSSNGSSFGGMSQPILSYEGSYGRVGDEMGAGRFWPAGGFAGNENLQGPDMQQHEKGGPRISAPILQVTHADRRAPPANAYEHQSANPFDDNRLSRGSVYPIAEHENEDGHSSVTGASIEEDRLSNAEEKLKEVKRMLKSDDPFADPMPNPLGSHPVGPVAGGTVRRVPTAASRASTSPRRPMSGISDGPNWTTTWRRENSNPFADPPTPGRTSPTKTDDRTSSTLSERSQRSLASTNSITRTMSTRTGAMLAAAAAAHRVNVDGHWPADDRSPPRASNAGGRKSPFHMSNATRSSTNGSISRVPEAESFTTARNTFSQLQSEGQALLGGRPEPPPHRHEAYRKPAQNPTSRARDHSPPPNVDPTPLVPPPGRQQGWMGSLRRAFNAVSMGERSFSLTGASDPFRDGPRSPSHSPTKDEPPRRSSAPRRTASDGSALLLRQKRGQKDWAGGRAGDEDDTIGGDWGDTAPSASYRRGGAAHDDNEEEEEEDWDVEGAASKRDVQVMFTVPKARLRVVNDDMDRASLRSASDGVVSRAGSLKNGLRREESVNGMRARSDGDRMYFLSTSSSAVADLDVGATGSYVTTTTGGTLHKQKAA